MATFDSGETIPIEMMEHTPRLEDHRRVVHSPENMRAITVLLLVVGRCIDLAVGLALGISAILGLAIFGPVKYVALSVVAIFATVLIHELGHLLAAVALGWNVRRI